MTKTLATMKAFTPPKPKAPPKVVQAQQPKPTPPQPQQAKAAPPPPPMPKPADVQVPEKPQPPKPEVAPQPPQPPQPLPPQKKQDMAFDTLLKNLASKPLPQDQPTQQSAKPQPSSQPIAPLGEQRRRPWWPCRPPAPHRSSQRRSTHCRRAREFA